MKARYYLLGCLALAACDAQEPRVVVNFDQPFPAGAPDLAGFLPRHRGRHSEQGQDSSRTLLVNQKALVESHFESAELPGAWLDSMGVPRQPGSYWARDGFRYQVRAPLAADSFRVRVEVYDTLLNLSSRPAPKLRRHRGWYYVSRPDLEDSTKWEVQRLSIIKGQVVWQLPNPDSLRIRALDPATVQQRRKTGQLFFTLAPQSRRAIGQVSSYDGLWLSRKDYVRQALIGIVCK
jgi:hypothetical protein